MAGLESQSLKQSLIKKAHQLGFNLVGVTTADPPKSFFHYQQWVAKGMQAEMRYLATERSLARREDPQLILPECQSILVLGIPYSHPDENPGGVAAYAWGDDYHQVLKPRLQEVVSFLEEQVRHPIPNRWYTDTGPILERDLANRAGLGWIGKNSMLIHPQYGSTFLLAEILLGVKLPEDEPFESDHCGSCSRCLDSCPTGCILPDRTLDAGRCLSYLTIENKGEISLALRAFFGEWIFGCDICQQVCPWNRFAPKNGDKQFLPRQGVPPKNLMEELFLSPEAFNRKFRGSAVKRAKRRGYLRNVAVVLGNRQRQQDIPGLAVCLKDKEPLIRQHAAWAIGEIGGDEAKEVLLAALQSETKPSVIDEIYAALECIDPNHKA